MTTPWIPDSYLDLILNQIKNSDRISICSTQPTTYFQACFPNIWTINTPYVVGDVVRSPTDNNMVYECTILGTSGAVEPPWSIVQDELFMDNDVQWKSHVNYTLVSTILVPAENTISDGTSGKKLTIPEKNNILIFRSGTVSCSALIEDSTKTLHFVANSETTIVENNDITSGKVVVIPSSTITIEDPLDA